MTGGTSPVRRVAIDLATLHPGRGGAGGGIWSYARHLVQELDRTEAPDVELVALAHADLPLDGLRRVRVARVAADTRSIAGRLRWIHLALPAWCRANDVRVLHKLTAEVPLHAGATRLVATVHDFMAEHYLARGYAQGDGGARLRRLYFARVARHTFANAARVVAVSEAVAAEARRRHPRAAGRIVVVPHGVEQDGARGAARPPRAAEAAGRVLVVGMFGRHKGQHVAVQAFERLAAHAPRLAAGASLTFRGFPAIPAYHAEVRALAARSPLAERIRFVGYAPEIGTREIYADADVLLFPSDYEGFGLPVLEAQAAGVPVVCSDIPAFREVAGDGACFVPPGDADAAAAALARVLGDRALRADLVRRGHANARRFSWARAARATLDVYRAAARTTPRG